MASLFFSHLPSSKVGLPKILPINDQFVHNLQAPVFNPQSLFLALLCISLLMISNVLPAHSLRRIQNDPYQPWDAIHRDYEYVDLEDQDVVAPPVPQHHPQNRPPASHLNYPAGPQPIAFGGQFHISRDRFVPFVASDVVLDQPATGIPQPNVHPKPKASPLVPSPVLQAYPPETTSEPSFIYYTPSTVYYVTTRSPTPRPANPETFVEKKRERFYSANETETFVRTGGKPDQETGHHSATIDPSYHDTRPGDAGRKAQDFSVFNKLTATEAQQPVTEFPHEFTTSQFFDFQRTFKPNTLYPYPTDRIRSGSEYRPSNPVVRQHSRNNLNAESETTERSIVTSGQPATEPPFQEKEQPKRQLSTGAIAGIAIGILAPLALVAGAVVYLFYGRHFKTAAHKGVNESYIDDSIRPSGFMNSHIELPKESSEEMTSLDNDSFLNSLEAVTIQNYWAESAKNTKV